MFLFLLKLLIKDGAEWIITQLWVLGMEKRLEEKLNKFIKTNQKEIDAILAKHNIPILELKPGKEKKVIQQPMR